VFSRTRFRLTAWYTAVMVAFVALLGTVVFYVVQSQLRGQVDAGMRSFAARVASDVADDIKHNQIVKSDPDLVQLQDGTLYKLAVSLPPFVTVSRNHPAAYGLPNQSALYSALQNGVDLRSVQAPDGPVRMYSVRKTYAGRTFVVQVARSTVPERQSLDNLLVVLLGGGGAGLAIAAVGGWFLAGKSLKPVREAFERQQSFVGDASHELRTPLAVIRANAEYL
jgi:two-component system, OmpR family, sensor histidine kinase CiaH